MCACIPYPVPPFGLELVEVGALQSHVVVIVDLANPHDTHYWKTIKQQN